jgi:flagellin
VPRHYERVPPRSIGTEAHRATSRRILSMRINTNVAGINSWRSLYKNDMAMSKSLEKLSSGLRINRSSDDAGGMAISETLRAQIRGVGQAEKNTQDAIGLLNIADSSMEQVHGMLQRMRELSVQSANGTLNAAGPDRVALDAEFQQLKTEIDRITASATFNGTAVFAATTTMQVGANNVANNQINVNVGTLTSAAALPVPPAQSGGLNIPATASIGTQATAQPMIDTINTAINAISYRRAHVGAMTNRLEYTVANLQSTRENLAAAESRIRDVDMASEMTNLTKQQILVQSSTAMLAQANARPQSVLALLQ